MWPTTIVAKAQRTYWTDGLNHLARIALNIATKKRITVASKTVPTGFNKEFDIAPDWLPMIPRDREAQVNELILRLQENGIPLSQALEEFGDIPDVQEAVKEIKDWMEFLAEVKAKQTPAQQDVQKPVASSGLSERT
jgi:hypothetical protein